MFFITSSDSGSLVIDSITAGGKIEAPVPQRVFWATTEGAIAAALLWIGGTEAIEALQAGAISTGLPFTIVLLLMCVSLVMACVPSNANAFARGRSVVGTSPCPALLSLLLVVVQHQRLPTGVSGR